MNRRLSLPAAGLALLLAACGGTPENATDVAENPYGATGAPGADLTDNGVNDGAAGFTQNGTAPVPGNATAPPP